MDKRGGRPGKIQQSRPRMLEDYTNVEEEERELNRRLKLLRRRRMALRPHVEEESSSDDESIEKCSGLLPRENLKARANNVHSPEDNLEEGEIPNWYLDMIPDKNDGNSTCNERIADSKQQINSGNLESEILMPHTTRPKLNCLIEIEKPASVVEKNVQPMIGMPAVGASAKMSTIAATPERQLLNDNEIEYCGEVCVVDDAHPSSYANEQTIVDQVSMLPRPILRCMINKKKDIQLSWSHDNLPDNAPKILLYELFVQIPQNNNHLRTHCIGKFRPLRLPMGCTVDRLLFHTQYYFAIRCLFDNGAFGPFGEKLGIYLKPKNNVPS